MSPITEVAPAFVAIAHRIVWATVATVAADGRPRTRVLHPIWEFDGATLTGWVATSPTSPKAEDLAHCPNVSVTYWDATQDTCTADCAVTWDASDDARAAGWARFAEAPAPYGYDPSIIPAWDSPDSEHFGVIRLAPTRLRVMPGAVMLAGQGSVLTWRQPT